MAQLISFDAVIKYAAKIRDRPLPVAAIEAKIEQIERLLRNAYGTRNLGSLRQ